MRVERFEWNVAVVGAWNLAILSPAGVAKRLFELASGTPIEVQVALDQPSSIRVLHDGLVVIPSESLLVIAPTSFDATSLASAARIASRAIKSLPETPLTAAGINVRYRFPEGLPDTLLNGLTSSLDDRLADADLRIASRAMKRSLEWKGGLLNVEVTEERDGMGTVLFNFHRESTINDELRAWVDNAEEVVGLCASLLSLRFNVSEGGGTGE